MAASFITFLVAVFYITLGLSAHAQTQVTRQYAEPVRRQDPNPTQIILKAVPSLGTLSADMGSLSTKMNFGIGFGVGFDASLGNTLSLETGVEWAKRGVAGEMTLSETIPDLGMSFQVSGTSSLTLNYLVVPMLLKAKFGTAQETRYFVGAGPYVGFFMSGNNSQKGTANLGGTIQNFDETQKISNEDVGTDFGLRASAGAEVPLTSSLGMVLGAQYDFGFSNISKSDDGPRDAVSTRSLLLNAGLAIRL